MTEKRIVYTADDGRVCVITPASGFDIAEVAAKDVPHGIAFEIVDMDQVAPDPGVPSAITCSKRQGELALLELESPTPEHPSLLHWVEAAIEATADPIEKRKMQAYFNAAEWHTDDPFVTQMWVAAGRDLAELHPVFAHANTL